MYFQSRNSRCLTARESGRVFSLWAVRSAVSGVITPSRKALEKRCLTTQRDVSDAANVPRSVRANSSNSSVLMQRFTFTAATRKKPPANGNIAKFSVSAAATFPGKFTVNGFRASVNYDAEILPTVEDIEAVKCPSLCLLSSTEHLAIEHADPNHEKTEKQI